MTASDTTLAYDPLLVDADHVAELRADFASRGVAVVGPPALRSDVHAALASEAEVQRTHAAWDLIGDGDNDTLPQDNVRAHLGPVARELVASGAARALLQRVTGRVVVPGWSATCLTFYDAPGSYLGRHTDKPRACGLAFLLYLSASWSEAGAGPGVQLHVEAEQGLLRVTCHPNRLIVLDGTRLPHYRPPTRDDEQIALLAGCYEVVGTYP